MTTNKTRTLDLGSPRIMFERRQEGAPPRNRGVDLERRRDADSVVFVRDQRLDALVKVPGTDDSAGIDGRH